MSNDLRPCGHPLGSSAWCYACAEAEYDATPRRSVAAIALDRSQREELARRCPNCDDTGQVSSITGEWRGRCHCVAGRTAPPMFAPSTICTADATSTPTAPGRAAGVGAVSEKTVPAPARTLAELVLHMDMVTEKGKHARALARQVLAGHDEALRLLRLIQHATAPNDLATAGVVALSTPPASPSLADMVPKAEGEAS